MTQIVEHTSVNRFEPSDQLMDSIEIKSSLLTDRCRSQSTNCPLTLVWIAVVLNSSVAEQNIESNLISHPFTILFHICCKWLFYFILQIHFHSFWNHIWWTNVTPLGIWAQVTFRILNVSKVLNLIKLFFYTSQLTMERPWSDYEWLD